MKPRVSWIWVTNSVGAAVIVRFEHLKLKFTLQRKPFKEGWEIEVKRGDVQLSGLHGRRTVKHCCNIMRREHGRAILRLFAGVEL